MGMRSHSFVRRDLSFLLCSLSFWACNRTPEVSSAPASAPEVDRAVSVIVPSLSPADPPPAATPAKENALGNSNWTATEKSAGKMGLFQSLKGKGGGAGGMMGTVGVRSAAGAVAFGAGLAGVKMAPDEHWNTEAYAHQEENDFRSPQVAPLSTFSVDVDTASYANVRRILHSGALPPVDAVRVEELINYFPYNYAAPKSEPFAANVEVADCPWAPKHRLVRIGLKGREIEAAKRPASNLVFLIDVSGSMMPDNKLPLLKRSLAMLVRSLDERDHVSMVVYAGTSGVVLPPTRGDQQTTILAALERLEAGGSTNGAQGIQLAYRLASKNFVKNGSNRVILATDGDFNVGVTDEGSLVRLIEEKRDAGVYLSVLGFGMGNVKDSTMEKLADKGNGNYAYIDTLQEGRKVLVEQMTGTLITIAKDVKLQIEFNPALVKAYRQVGYENRQLRDEDFNNDKIDAGDIGAGHTVTALYEIVPVGVEIDLPKVDPLKYRVTAPTVTTGGSELCTVKIRYKPPAGETSQLSSFVVADDARTFNSASTDFKLAAAAAEFGMLLRASKHSGSTTWKQELELARAGRGEDPHGYRAELIQLSELAEHLRR